MSNGAPVIRRLGLAAVLGATLAMGEAAVPAAGRNVPKVTMLDAFVRRFYPQGGSSNGRGRAYRASSHVWPGNGAREVARRRRWIERGLLSPVYAEHPQP